VIGSASAVAAPIAEQAPVVAALLGVGLGALFVVTGSLLAVVLAHYLVNALEFVVHEGLGVEFGVQS